MNFTQLYCDGMESERFHSDFLYTIRSHELSLSNGVSRVTGIGLRNAYVKAAEPSHREDVMSVFRALREKHIKFIGGVTQTKLNHQKQAQAQQAPGFDTEQQELVVSPFLQQHSLLLALMNTVDVSMSLMPIADRERCIAKLVERATIGITGDPIGMVKQFRKVMNIKHPSIEDMSSTLYDTKSLFRDDHMNDIVIYYLASLFKVTILIFFDTPEVKMYPLDASIHDGAVLIKYDEERGYQLAFVNGRNTDSLLAVYRKIAREWWDNNQVKASQISCSELTQVLRNRIGVASSKQTMEIFHAFQEEVKTDIGGKTIRITKKIMGEVLLGLIQA